MTSQPAPLFNAPDHDDAALAATIAATLATTLPPACQSGVAANARLIQHHVDILRGAAS